jgi:prolyl-tRNA synthetase
MIMTHADDDGLVVPPKVAPTHAVILPVTPKEDTRAQVLEACEELAKELRAQTFSGGSIRVDVDDRDLRGGEKYWSWVKKGIPLTIEIGPRDLEKGTVFVGRRDQGAQREGMERKSFVEQVPSILEEMQANLFAKALAFREENTVTIDNKDELYAYFTPKNKSKPEIHGGFVLAHWDRDPKWEEQLKNDLKVTVRCIPEETGESGTCIFSGNPSPGRVVLAKSY